MVRWDDDTEYAKDRYRQTHDVRHILLGVGIDGYEEVLLQTFQFAQQPQVLSAAIIVLGGIKHGLLEGKLGRMLSLMPAAWRQGKKAVFLSNVRFESMWHWPIEAARQALDIEAIGPEYPALTQRVAA